jgi:hypothetical protein
MADLETSEVLVLEENMNKSGNDSIFSPSRMTMERTENNEYSIFQSL